MSQGTEMSEAHIEALKHLRADSGPDEPYASALDAAIRALASSEPGEGRTPIAWACETSYGPGYSFSNQFIEMFPNFPEWIPAHPPTAATPVVSHPLETNSVVANEAPVHETQATQPEQVRELVKFVRAQKSLPADIEKIIAENFHDYLD